MKPVKIVSTTGKKQVSQAATAERGELVTFVGIISASGQSLPPTTGIWPMNRLVFSNVDFTPSAVTDEPLPNVDNSNNIAERTKVIEDENGNSGDITILQNTPSCSETKTKRTPGTSKLSTDTPEKERLKQIENEKNKKKCFKRNIFTKLEKQVDNQPKKKRRTKIPSDSSSSESDGLSIYDNSDKEISDEMEDIEENCREDLNDGDFVLVRFKAKTKLVHFVRQILKYSKDTTTLRFMRKKGLSTTFYFPAIDDI
ncbi:hypothetical protein RN001_016057 [Aquatica leii]|uniref:Uncharacterized protein n=1 Tax=Aquatica leii TaxID=1421715 RepID=A0AAN7SK86_9COLE|nr:hypothetical protein RN001_016057 [Aquatica leii]